MFRHMIQKKGQMMFDMQCHRKGVVLAMCLTLVCAAERAHAIGCTPDPPPPGPRYQAQQLAWDVTGDGTQRHVKLTTRYVELVRQYEDAGIPVASIESELRLARQAITTYGELVTRAINWSNDGDALAADYERSGDETALDVAIECWDEAVRIVLEDAELHNLEASGSLDFVEEMLD